MALRSPVEYRKDGKYGLQEKMEVSAQDEDEARQRGIKDAKTPLDVMQNKASVYEKELQHRWGKNLMERIGYNAIRLKQWGVLIRPELQNLILAKGEFEERLGLRKHKLSDSQLGIVAYVAILTILTLVEMPINVAVFNIFGDSIVFTFLLAGLLSVVLSLLAHFVGGWLKTEGLRARSFFLIGLVVVLIGILAWVRLRFFSSSPDSPLKDYFKGLEVGVIVVMFFIINTLLFVMAIVASHHHHDSDPLFVKAKKSYACSYNKVTNLMSAWEGELLNLRMCIPRCQECFKNNRYTYIDAYRSTGVAEPLCFKEHITVETSRITDLDANLKTIEEECNELRNIVQAVLEPINPTEQPNYH